MSSLRSPVQRCLALAGIAIVASILLGIAPCDINKIPVDCHAYQVLCPSCNDIGHQGHCGGASERVYTGAQIHRIESTMENQGCYSLVSGGVPETLTCYYDYTCNWDFKFSQSCGPIGNGGGQLAGYICQENPEDLGDYCEFCTSDTSSSGVPTNYVVYPITPDSCNCGS